MFNGSHFQSLNNNIINYKKRAMKNISSPNGFTSFRYIEFCFCNLIMAYDFCNVTF